MKSALPESKVTGIFFRKLEKHIHMCEKGGLHRTPDYVSLYPSQTLSFDSRGVETALALKNNTDFSVAYRVRVKKFKATTPRLFNVKPHHWLIRPRHTSHITIAINPCPDLQLVGHQILVMSCIVNLPASASQSEIKQALEACPKQLVQRTQLDVTIGDTKRCNLATNTAKAIGVEQAAAAQADVIRHPNSCSVAPDSYDLPSSWPRASKQRADYATKVIPPQIPSSDADFSEKKLQEVEETSTVPEVHKGTHQQTYQIRLLNIIVPLIASLFLGYLIYTQFNHH
jgi:hypothetical protein